MDMISSLFTSALIADIVIAVMVIEALVLVAGARIRSNGPRAMLIIVALLPGLFLALALRAALVQAQWVWLALALLGALVTHLIDMRLRYRQHESSSFIR
jgi:hypothetical protein